VTLGWVKCVYGLNDAQHALRCRDVDAVCTPPHKGHYVILSGAYVLDKICSTVVLLKGLCSRRTREELHVRRVAISPAPCHQLRHLKSSRPKAEIRSECMFRLKSVRLLVRAASPSYPSTTGSTPPFLHAVRCDHRFIGRAKRGQSRGWLGFRTGVTTNVVYLRKPAFAERCAHLQARWSTALSTTHAIASASCQGHRYESKPRRYSCTSGDGLGGELKDSGLILCGDLEGEASS
jgi:hypothetical protein